MACNNCKSKEGSMAEKFKKAGEQLPENWKRTLLITCFGSYFYHVWYY